MKDSEEDFRKQFDNKYMLAMEYDIPQAIRRHSNPLADAVTEPSTDRPTVQSCQLLLGDVPDKYQDALGCC